ncbi:peptidoglycan-binding protein [Streptomyces sp. NPDC059009]|uniref:peptidoglycan-binding domain-containing protein n=1 Tax=Streptomyces sp. NPDC059009 TaxID=3346694 RepID=UPI003677766E
MGHSQRDAPEFSTHRRRSPLRRPPVLAALGAVAIPCVVVAGIQGIERSKSHAAPPSRDGLPASWAPSDGTGRPTGGSGGPSASPSGGATSDSAGATKGAGRGKSSRPSSDGARGDARDPARDRASHRAGASGDTGRAPAPPSSRGPARPTPSHPAPSASSSSPASASPTLKRGDRGAAVEAMQRQLYSIGFYHGHRYGEFDADTEKSVRRFQSWDAVADQVASDVPGTYGPATKAALDRWAS